MLQRLLTLITVILVLVLPLGACSLPQDTELLVTDSEGRPLPGAVVYVPGYGNITTNDAGVAIMSRGAGKPNESTVMVVYYATPIGMITEELVPRNINGTLVLRTRLKLADLYLQYIGLGEGTITILANGKSILALNHTSMPTTKIIVPLMIPSGNTVLPVSITAVLKAYDASLELPLIINASSARIPVYVDDSILLIGVEPEGSPLLTHASNEFYACRVLGGAYYGALSLGFQTDVSMLTIVKGAVEGRLSFIGNIERSASGFTVYYPLKNCVYGYVVKPGEQVVLELDAVHGNSHSHYKVLVKVPEKGSINLSQTQASNTARTSASKPGHGGMPGVIEAEGGGGEQSNSLVGIIAVSAAVIAGLAVLLALISRREEN